MIYLDHAATTPLDPAVLKKMMPFFSARFANPASVHTPGQAALKAVDDARYRIASLLETAGSEIVFCSGSTEANNLALHGVIEASGCRQPHIITTAVEHSSVLEPLAYLASRGAKVTYLPVDQRGCITPDSLLAAITPETVLVSIALANSETGVIQPLKKIGRLLRKHNDRVQAAWLNTSPRKRGVQPRRVLFHSDATQAPNLLDCRPGQYLLDLLSLSGHKMYGPKGIGLLFIRQGVTLSPLLRGGHQERNIRSGTVNVPGVIGLAAALERAVLKRPALTLQLSRLRDRLASQIMQHIPSAVINTDSSISLASHLNVSFPGLDGEALLSALDEEGIAVSTGSACASGDVSVSPVLRAMGRSEATARAALRFSLGRATSAADITAVMVALRRLTKSVALRA